MAETNYNALGQAIDTTWGRSSTPNTHTYSVKFQMIGKNVLKATYGVIVNFGTEKAMIDMKKRYAEESIAIMNEVLKSVKSTYKELAGKTLKTKEISTCDSIEITNMSPYNPKRSALYRRMTMFEV